MREQRVDGDLVALDDAEDPGRQARLGEQLGDEQRGRRVLLARLEDERVPARERERVHPHRDHRREVERRDAGDDAERLAVARRVDAGRDLLGRLALHQVRDAAGELDDLQAALHLAARVVEGLAVLAGDDAGEVVAPRGQQLAVGEEDGGALRERGGAPVRRTRRARRATARSTSAADASATRRATWPVAGSWTSAKRSAASSGAPPIQWPTVFRSVGAMVMTLPGYARIGCAP